MDRNESWVRGSFALARHDQWLVPVLQGLGRLDVRLIDEDERFLHLSDEERSTDAELIAFDELRTLSYLWVLGAYELIRTLHQRMRTSPRQVGTPAERAVGELKRTFNRLRVPLAKLEPSGSNPSDSPIAYPAIHPTKGAAWQIARDTFVTRLELSGALLDLLEHLRDVDPLLPKNVDAG
jgi:hypothetical protein